VIANCNLMTVMTFNSLTGTAGALARNSPKPQLGGTDHVSRVALIAGE
jgi:hypothetical protein